MSFRGPKYTWSNCRESREYIKECLDRGVANVAWCEIFPSAEILVEGQTNLDHAMLTLFLISQSRMRNKTRWFRYEASWELDVGYSDLISKVRSEAMPSGHGGNVGLKLERCKHQSQCW